jgi:hypothetical protein
LTGLQSRDFDGVGGGAQASFGKLIGINPYLLAWEREALDVILFADPADAQKK